jgi:hypothetical protein
MNLESVCAIIPTTTDDSDSVSLQLHPLRNEFAFRYVMSPLIHAYNGLLGYGASRLKDMMCISEKVN